MPCPNPPSPAGEESDEGEAEPYPTISSPAGEEPHREIISTTEQTGAEEINIAITTPPTETTTTTGARRLPGQRAVDFIVTHPSQTRFACPVCKLVYTTHSSLVRHVDVSHKRLTLNISFKCALCDYVHANLRSTSNHFRLEHSAAVPPMTIDGSNEKACPFCQKTFSYTRSCSTHGGSKRTAGTGSSGEGSTTGVNNSENQVDGGRNQTVQEGPEDAWTKQQREAGGGGWNQGQEPSDHVQKQVPQGQPDVAKG